MTIHLAEKIRKVTNFPLRDDYVWALLRNLKVLSGLRMSEDDKPLSPPRSFVAGRGAHLLAKRMESLEPALTSDVRLDYDLGTSFGREDASLKEVARGAYDCTVVTQPHQFLLDREHVTNLRKTLHPEKGIAGFVWVRLANSSMKLPWIQAFTTMALQSGGRGTQSPSDLSTFRSIQLNESPMEYFDNELNLPLSGFKPPVHRKFVESITGPKRDIFRLIQLTHDILRPGLDFVSEFEAAMVNCGEKDIATIDLDIHLFIAQQQQSSIQQKLNSSVKAEKSSQLTPS